MSADLKRVEVLAEALARTADGGRAEGEARLAASHDRAVATAEETVSAAQGYTVKWPLRDPPRTKEEFELAIKAAELAIIEKKLALTEAENHGKEIDNRGKEIDVATKRLLLLGAVVALFGAIGGFAGKALADKAPEPACGCVVSNNVSVAPVQIWRSQSSVVMNNAPPDAASTHAEPEYLTVKEVADLLRVNVKTVHKMLAAGELRHLRHGKIIRIPASALPR